MRRGKMKTLMNQRQKLALGLWLTVGSVYAQTAVGQTGTTDGIWRSDSLQEVVVTATGTQHLLKDAPVQTEVITSKMLRQYGGSSLQDILAGLAPSLAFNEGDMGSQMQLGGLGNNYILVLVDGKRLHGDVGGENDLSLIDPHNIERIEIVKGAASALYGSDAIAGVLNIITRKPLHESLMAENVTRYGSYNDLRQHNALGLGLGKVRSLTNFQLQHSDGWQNTATEYTPSSTAPITDSRSMTVNRHTNWQLAEQLSLALSPQLELYASGSYYRKGIYRPKGKYPKYDVKTFDLKYRNASAAFGGRWKGRGEREQTVTLDIDWNRHAYYHAFTSTTLAEGFDEQGRLILDYPYFEGQQLLQSNQERAMMHLKGITALPHDHRLSGGLEVRYDYLKAPTSLERASADDNTEALYVQDEWSIAMGHDDRERDVMLHLTPGLRLNRNKGFGLRLTPKLSAMMAWGDLRLRASWSEGFKTPTLKEMNYRYIREMNTVTMYLGNRNLKAQTSDYLSLNGEYTKGGVNITVTGYYNKVDRMITLVTVPRTEAPDDYRQQYGEMLGKVRRYQNMEDARTMGFDVSLRYTAKSFSAGLAYSYLDTKAHVYDSSHEQLKEVTIDGMAHHKANVFATWQPTKDLGLGVYGRMSTKRYYQIDGDGKGYQIWRATARYDLSALRALRQAASAGLGMSLEAGIDNILNYCDRTPHGLHLGTTTAGRTVYATLTVSFRKGKRIQFTNNTKSNFKKQEQDEED